MDACDIPRFLVKPAAGVIHQPLRIQPGKPSGGIRRVKLPPALVEGNPADDAGMDPQGADGFLHLLKEGIPPFFLPPGKKTAGSFSVRHGDGKGVQQRGKIGDEPASVSRASAHHILPDQHAEPVAVIVPPLGLHLHMLAQHVEAKLLHCGDVKDKGLVAGRGVQAVRPVALIQHPGLKAGAVVQKKPPDPFFIRLNVAFSHGKIAFHPVLIRLHGQMIKKGILRRPRVEAGKGYGCLLSGGEVQEKGILVCRGIFL